MEKKIKELQAACEELRREITQRQAESKNLKEDLEAKKREIQADKKTYEEANEEKERLKVRFDAMLTLQWHCLQGVTMALAARE